MLDCLRVKSVDKDSPAGGAGLVEAGDTILSVNKVSALGGKDGGGGGVPDEAALQDILDVTPMDKKNGARKIVFRLLRKDKLSTAEREAAEDREVAELLKLRKLARWRLRLVSSCCYNHLEVGLHVVGCVLQLVIYLLPYQDLTAEPPRDPWLLGSTIVVLCVLQVLLQGLMLFAALASHCFKRRAVRYLEAWEI